MTDHPFQPGTVWAPRKGNAPLRRVIEPRDTQFPSRTWLAEFVARPDIVWYEGSDYPVTLATFRRWAGEQVAP